MHFVLALLGVVFAAWCTWLTVRAVNRPEESRRLIAVTALGMAALLCYPLSFGPASRLSVDGVIPSGDFVMAYRPCIELAADGINGPPSIAGLLWWWVEQWGGEEVLLEIFIIGPGDDPMVYSIWPGRHSLIPPENLNGRFWLVAGFATFITLTGAAAVGLWISLGKRTS